MKQLVHTLRAVPTLLKVGFADALAYRAEFIIWVFAYTMPLIMLALWTSVAREGPVQGFNERDFQAYFLTALVVRLVTGAWVIWELNQEVREGTLQKRLLRPVHPLFTYLTENLAAIPMRLAVALPITLISLWFVGTSALSSSPAQLWLAPLAVFGAFLLTFCAMTAIGALALFWESSLSLFELWLGLYTVLSGYVMPLEFFPEALQTVIRCLPFRAMLAFPIETILGRISLEESFVGLGLQWLWIGIFALLTHVLWCLGMRRFAAYGG